MRRENQICEIINDCLDDSLLNPKWFKIVKNLSFKPKGVGHCYIGAEAAFHLLGGRKQKIQSFVITHKWWQQGLAPGETHWFLKNKNGQIIDPTKNQFGKLKINYDAGKACGFLTKQPSKRCKILIERVLLKLNKKTPTINGWSQKNYLLNQHYTAV
jgi:hypothetical protein